MGIVSVPFGHLPRSGVARSYDDSMFNLLRNRQLSSFLKHPSGTEILKTGALPLGIIKNTEPFIDSVILCDDDCVIFVSDGVVDSFDSENELCDYIDGISDPNPQSIANGILSKAVELSDNLPRDDMTVLVAKIKKL